MSAYLYQQWIEAKERERHATEDRRCLEDMLINQFGIDPNVDRAVTIDKEGYKIKVTCRLSHTVDSDLLQEVAAEHGIQDSLHNLFRWKADIDMKAWKAAPEEVTKVLNKAITTKAGRPSFSITTTQEQ